jgi:hypothetical protein
MCPGIVFVGAPLVGALNDGMGMTNNRAAIKAAPTNGRAGALVIWGRNL